VAVYQVFQPQMGIRLENDGLVVYIDAVSHEFENGDGIVTSRAVTLEFMCNSCGKSHRRVLGGLPPTKRIHIGCRSCMRRITYEFEIDL